MLEIFTFNLVYDKKLWFAVIPIAITYLWRLMRSKSELYYAKTENNLKIIQRCPNIAKRRYYPTIYLLNPLIHTWMSTVVSTTDENISYVLEEVKLKGGGHTTLAWAEPKKEARDEKKNNTIVVILPGLTASYQDHYIKALTKSLLLEGYKPVIYHPRFNGENLVFPEQDHLDILKDFSDTIEYILQHKKGFKFFAIGHSYGANLLVKFLGKKSKENPFYGAVSLANPCNFMLSEAKMRGGIIDKSMNQMLIRASKKAKKDTVNSKRFNINWDKIETGKNVNNFDWEFTIKVYGYDTPDDYYWDVSSSRWLKSVQVPLLLLQAEDDPVVEAKGIPRDIIQGSNSKVIVYITKCGGHLGWLEGFIRLKRWYLKPTIEFINAVTQDSN